MHSRLIKTIALMSLAAVAVAAMQDAVLLRRTFKAGTTEIYKVESTTKTTAQTPMGPQENGFSVKSTIKVAYGDLDDQGRIAVTQTTTVDDMQAEGMMAGMMGGQKPPPITTTAKLDVRNRPTDAKAAATDAMAALAGNIDPSSYTLFIELPEKAVKPGDSWELTVPKNPMLSKTDQKLNAKLVEAVDMDGVKAWKVAITGDLKVEPDMEAMMRSMPQGSPMQGMTMEVKGKMNMVGEVIIAQDNGRTLSASFTAKGNTDINVTSMGMTVAVESESKSKMTLQK